MKNILGYLVVLLILVGAITVYRATTYFEDSQYKPTSKTDRVAIDTDAALDRFSKAIQLKTIK